jgi:hypothetical protein
MCRLRAFAAAGIDLAPAACRLLLVLTTLSFCAGCGGDQGVDRGSAADALPWIGPSGKPRLAGVWRGQNTEGEPLVFTIRRSGIVVVPSELVAYANQVLFVGGVDGNLVSLISFADKEPFGSAEFVAADAIRVKLKALDGQTHVDYELKREADDAISAAQPLDLPRAAERLIGAWEAKQSPLEKRQLDFLADGRVYSTHVADRTAVSALLAVVTDKNAGEKTGRWSLKSADADVLVVETREMENAPAREIQITLQDADHITLSGGGYNPPQSFTRIARVIE